MVHGVFGCNGEWQYMLAVTNGDGGDTTRNVLNPLTSDNLAYSGRLNWAFLKGIGYTEGALKQGTCQWYGELGVWGHYYADRLDGGTERPRLAHRGLRPSGGGSRPGAGLRRLLVHGGGDVLRGHGLGRVSPTTKSGCSTSSRPVTTSRARPGRSRLAGAATTRTIKAAGGDIEPSTQELGVAVNYYLNGHGNKLQFDFSYFDASADGLQGGGWYDMYAGVPLGFNSNSSQHADPLPVAARPLGLRDTIRRSPDGDLSEGPGAARRGPSSCVVRTGSAVRAVRPG